MLFASLLRRIKSRFGIYESGYTYMVPFSKIYVPLDFCRTQINKYKWISKLRYFEETGKLQSKILLTKDFILIDGYSSYCIARTYELKKVPVQFVDYLDERNEGKRRK